MNDKIGDKKIQESLKRIAEYFVYRYLAPTYFTGEFSAVMKFTLVSCVVILALISEKKDIGICDAFKEYSKQIEYNPDTMDKLLADLYSLDFFESAELISLI